MNKSFFVPLAILLAFIGIYCLKNNSIFVKRTPLYCLAFSLCYVAIQGYGSYRLLEKSNLNQLFSILQQQRQKKPIVFYLSQPNSADYFISYLDFFILKRHQNYQTITPEKVK